jgi:photosystem II oxygen-evolving enhancer protein 1
MKFRGLIAALMAVCIGFLTACSDSPANATSSVPLTYEQIRNTGLANNCPTIADISRGSIDLDSNKKYQFVDMCLQPTEYFVEVEPANKRQKPEFVKGKVVTRATSSLDQIKGSITFNDEGKLIFKEEDGIDFQAITVKMPGGELVPFLFTIKELVAISDVPTPVLTTSTDFSGEFKVPSYRGSVFLDPKGRGVASGYDNAIALPAEADSSKLSRTNVKRTDSFKGNITFEVAKINAATGEVAGIFTSQQTSDTDLGADDPEKVRIRGVFYTRLETKA